MVHVRVALERLQTVSAVRECCTTLTQLNYANLHVHPESSAQPLPIPANFVTQNAPPAETETAIIVWLAGMSLQVCICTCILIIIAIPPVRVDIMESVAIIHVLLVIHRAVDVLWLQLIVSIVQLEITGRSDLMHVEVVPRDIMEIILLFFVLFVLLGVWLALRHQCVRPVSKLLGWLTIYTTISVFRFALLLLSEIQLGLPVQLAQPPAKPALHQPPHVWHAQLETCFILEQQPAVQHVQLVSMIVVQKLAWSVRYTVQHAP